MARITHNIDSMNGYHQVKAGKSLHWPRDMRDWDTLARGGEGYVVNLDHPWEKHFCRGQERFLEKARSAVEEDCKPIIYPVAVKWMRANGYTAVAPPKRTRRRAMDKNAEKSVDPEPGGLPGLDQPTRRRRTKKEEAADVVESSSDADGS